MNAEAVCFSLFKAVPVRLVLRPADEPSCFQRSSESRKRSKFGPEPPSSLAWEPKPKTHPPCYDVVAILRSISLRRDRIANDGALETVEADVDVAERREEERMMDADMIRHKALQQWDERRA